MGVAAYSLPNHTSLGLNDHLRNKLELSSTVYAQIQAQASISFVALKKRLQTETGVKMRPVFVYANSLC